MKFNYRKYVLVGGFFPPKDTNVIWFSEKDRTLKIFRDGRWVDIYTNAQIAEAILGTQENIIKIYELAASTKESEAKVKDIATRLGLVEEEGLPEIRDIIRGEELTVEVVIEADGFNIDTDNWKVDFMIDGKVMDTRTNADMQTYKGHRYVTVGTSGWDLGEVYCKFTFYIPDAIQTSGTRLALSRIHSHWRIIE